MTEQTNDTPPEAAGEATDTKAGRGPTRWTVRMADIVDAATAASDAVTHRLLGMLDAEESPDRVDEDVRAMKAGLRAYIDRVEAEIRDESAALALLRRVLSLPSVGQAAFRATMTAVAEEAKPKPLDAEIAAVVADVPDGSTEHD